MDGTLRPLGVGELLDAAIKITKRRFKPMVLAVAVVVAPVMVVSALVQVSSGAGDPDPAFLETDPQTGLAELDGGKLGIFMAGTLVNLVLIIAATALATAAAFRLVSGVYLGDEPTWQESLRFAVRRFWPVLGLTVVTFALLLVGLVACVVPYFWLTGMLGVTMPALLVERAGVFGSIRRSWQLVRGRFWPVFGAVFLGTLLATIVQGFFSAPVLVLAFLDVNAVLLAGLTAIANLVGMALTTPFVAALTMVVYFDLRVRKEGFDLHLLAQRIGVDAPSGGFPGQPGTEGPAPWTTPAPVTPGPGPTPPPPRSPSWPPPWSPGVDDPAGR